MIYVLEQGQSEELADNEEQTKGKRAFSSDFAQSTAYHEGGSHVEEWVHSDNDAEVLLIHSFRRGLNGEEGANLGEAYVLQGADQSDSPNYLTLAPN